MSADANSILLEQGPDALRDWLDGAEVYVPDTAPAADGATDMAQAGPDRPLAGRRLTFTRFSQLRLGTAARYLVKGLIPSVGMVVVWGHSWCSSGLCAQRYADTTRSAAPLIP